MKYKHIKVKGGKFLATFKHITMPPPGHEMMSCIVREYSVLPLVAGREEWLINAGCQSTALCYP